MKASSLVASLLLAESAFSTELVCDVSTRGPGGHTNNGIAHCDALDFSFGRQTTGKYYLINVSKPIQRVIWEGNAKCDGGLSCFVSVQAYSSNSASAVILYKDGTFEKTNTSSMTYEAGH